VILELESSRSITQETLICEEGSETWTKLSDSSLATHLPNRPKLPKLLSSLSSDLAKRSVSFWTHRWASIPCIIFLILTFLGGTAKTIANLQGLSRSPRGLNSRSRDNVAALTALSFLAGDEDGTRRGLNQIKKGDAYAISRLSRANSNITEACESQGAFFALSLLFGAIWFGMQIFVRLRRKNLSGAILG